MLLTLRQMANRVLEKKDLTATNTKQLNKVLDWINIRYDRIVRSFPWTELQRQYNLTVVASQKDYALQRDVDEIIKMVDITNGIDLPEISNAEHAEIIAPLQDVTGSITTGDPQGYYQLRTLTCKQAMSAADTVEIVSSNNNDDSPNAIRVCGEVSGVELCENITLTGTTAATSTNTYDSGSMLKISLGTTDGTDADTAGTITVRESTDTTKVKSIIKPGDNGTEYKWLTMFPTPPATGTMPTIRVLYRKRPTRLINVMDIPEFDCCNELIQGAFADLLFNDSDPRSQQEEAMFNFMVSALMKKSETKPNYIMQFTPKMDLKKVMGRRTGFLGSVPYSGV